jgi:hypothetical protein
MVDNEILKNLGPLAPLVGIWEGSKGDDIAPSDDRGIENNKYRERMIFEPISRTENHEQVLYGLRYSTTAWRIGEENPFHEDLGYWLWDVQDKQVMKCFVIPRGITIIAGGTVDANAKTFSISAKSGSNTYGFCHNLFLEKEFKITGFDMTITIHDSKSFSYEQNTMLLLKGRKDTFDHRDKNTLSLQGQNDL